MDNNSGLTTRILNFYSEDENTYKRWYIDLPGYIEAGGQKEDLEMVCGADTLLDNLAKDNKDKTRVSLKVSEIPFKNNQQLDKAPDNLLWESGFDSGALYFVDTVYDHYYNGYIWLCDVTKFVFKGIFPETIYFSNIAN